MLSSYDHIVFNEVHSNSSNKYNTCTSLFVICDINYMSSSDAVPAFSHAVHFCVASDTVSGTKSRTNIVGSSAVHVCLLITMCK